VIQLSRWNQIALLET